MGLFLKGIANYNIQTHRMKIKPNLVIKCGFLIYKQVLSW